MPVFRDHSGRAAGPWALRACGLFVAIVIVVAGLLISSYTQGKFADHFTVTIDAATLGEGLEPGAEVKFHGFAIGTVRRVETVGYGHQRLVLELDRAQAAVLTDDVSARFTSSNVFGSSAIELVTEGKGARLRENTTLSIGENATNATVAGVFRRAARLARVLDSDEVRRIFDLLIENSSNLGPTVSAFFDMARMLATNQRAPLAHYLEIGAETSEGIAEITPSAVDVILGILDHSEYFGDPTNKKRTQKALAGVNDKLVIAVTDLLHERNPNLAQIIDGVLDLVVPISASIGTIAPAYPRLPALLGAIGSAFPVVDGQVQLQLEVIVKNMPYLADSLIPTAPGGAR
ncbi:MlaD family protein [Nocardia sp. GCM10030253]|uniref:MlaD family protein n=1 Tax=Nocardia sp. GCM10030253 TaxID=3273404 RepID=UPI00362FBDC0